MYAVVLHAVCYKQSYTAREVAVQCMQMTAQMRQTERLLAHAFTVLLEHAQSQQHARSGLS
jgi:hypothetical protein